MTWERKAIVIEFANPERLWWLLLVPALGFLYVILLVWRNDHSEKDLQQMLDRQRGWVKHVVVLLSVLSLASMLAAWARPQAEVEVPVERATVVLCFDVSYSMEATDVAPDRLTAAKDAANGFIDEMPDGFNIAIVDFARQASLVSGPSNDHQEARNAVDSLRLRPSTAIGEGIYEGLDSLAQVPPDPDHPDRPVPATIVVMSDGESRFGRDPFTAAADAKEQHVPVHTIAYGTTSGTMRDPDTGQTIPVPVNPEQLREIANAGGGQAFVAESAEQLTQAFSEIARSAGVAKEYREVTARYVGFGLTFAILASLGMVSLAARWP